MRDAVLFDGPDVSTRLSRFWILLVLASLIASAGVLADSTATVIGAMIVAPMMLPIQGTMLSIVLADRANLFRSVGLMVAGAATAVGVGWAIGLLAVNPVVAATNSQVAGRVSPNLVDLIAALATGAVGSIALVRKDISDTLPGVAIAISLVPPLCVCGITLESGSYAQSLGAALLFVTNVAAILLTGVVVMAVAGVQRQATEAARAEGRAVDRRRAVVVIAAMIVVVGVPLTINTVALVSTRSRERAVTQVAESWADPVSWHVVQVATREDRVTVTAEGPAPIPSTNGLRTGLADAGVDPAVVTVVLVPTTTVDLGQR